MSRIRDIIALTVSMCAVSLSIIACSGPLKPEEGSTVLARFLSMPEVVLPPQTQYNRSNPNFQQTREACLELKAVRDNWYAKFASFDHPGTQYSWDGHFHIWKRSIHTGCMTLRISEGDTLWCFLSNSRGEDDYYIGMLYEKLDLVSFSIDLSRYFSISTPGSFGWSISDSLTSISDEMGYGMVDSIYGGGWISRSDWCVLTFWAQWDAYGHGRLGYHSDPGGEGRW